MASHDSSTSSPSVENCRQTRKEESAKRKRDGDDEEDDDDAASKEDSPGEDEEHWYRRCVYPTSASDKKAKKKKNGQGEKCLKTTQNEPQAIKKRSRPPIPYSKVKAIRELEASVSTANFAKKS